MAKLKSVEDLKNLRLLLKDETFKEDKERIRACTGTACVASGAKKVIDNIEKDAREKDIDLEIVKTGCQGLCQKGPVMKVEPFGYFYQRVKENDASEIVSNTLRAGYPVRRLLYRDAIYQEPYELMDTLPFYKKQFRIALRNNGSIDPQNIHHYIAVDGDRKSVV